MTQGDINFDKAMGHVRRLYEALQRFDVLAAKALSLKLTELRCVNILGAGELTPSEIGQKLGLTSGSVTALVDRLEAKRIVKREGRHDRRSVAVSLLPEFRAEAQKVFAILGAQIRKELKRQRQTESDELISALSSVANGVWVAADTVEKLPRPRKRKTKGAQ